jgi:Protein of unknown function (DUF2809)
MKTMPGRPIGISLAVMLITIAAGLAVRFAPLGLPPFIVKYGGSTLWAVMIYWLLSTLLPLRRIIPVTLGAGALATGVEFLKLYRSPPLDAFRHTLPGIILLGRYFSVWDILAYWLAIFVAALLDAQILRPHKPQASS